MPRHPASRTGLGLTAQDAPQFGGDSAALKQKFTEIFASRTRAEWCAVFDEVDACVTPVLSLDEASRHPQRRGEHCPGAGRHPAPGGECPGWGQPRAAPALQATPPLGPCRPLPAAGEHTREILRECGYSDAEMSRLDADGAVTSKL